ncbi:MAG TPA: polyprenyl synthetase family protein [Rectinemataceae bacterium]|nr:polyprenyl synthetase family protein [Rectinemataceae bacterium]
MRDEYTELLESIEEELRAVLPESPDDAWLERYFGPLPAFSRQELRDSLNAPALDLIRRGGKRWRPLLLASAARAFGRDDGAIALTPLIEIAHNGTLIVDDIEDGADMRRGGPAIHILHGIDVAVNAGNLLYFLPLVLIDRFEAPESVRLELHARYGLHMRRLHLGQALDITWHRDHRRIPDRDSYLAMCALKTGVLARAAAEFGAVAAGASRESAGKLGDIFEGAGVAFQILDDVRNLRSGNPGKKRGDDIVEGKKSLPVILACAAQPQLHAELLGLFETAAVEGADSPAVEAAIGTIAATGALDLAETQAAEILDRATRDLEALLPPSGSARLLAGLIPLLRG